MYSNRIYKMEVDVDFYIQIEYIMEVDVDVQIYIECMQMQMYNIFKLTFQATVKLIYQVKREKDDI